LYGVYTTHGVFDVCVRDDTLPHIYKCGPLCIIGTNVTGPHMCLRVCVCCDRVTVLERTGVGRAALENCVMSQEIMEDHR